VWIHSWENNDCSRCISIPYHLELEGVISFFIKMKKLLHFTFIGQPKPICVMRETSFTIWAMFRVLGLRGDKLEKHVLYFLSKDGKY
jgi:hypothetical protein